MNGADSSVSDPYVQEFVLDTFSNVAIKPEIICPNPVGDSTLNDDAASTVEPKPSSVSTIVGLPEDDLLRHSTPDSVIMSHSQISHRLPPMSMLHSQASPPPHLLTPPESQDDYYPPLHHHHQLMSSSMMKNCNLIIPGNLPDTPPISSPPLPPAIYHHLEHHHIQPQYSPLQTLHHLHQPSAGEVAEDMLWLSQSTDLQPPRQEPLDLRPHCNGDSIQNWNMMQHHTSVITGPGKRIYHTDYFHHQASLGQYPPSGQLQALSPLLTTSSTSPSNSSSSSMSLSLTASTKSLVAHNGLESQARSMDGRTSVGSRSSSRGRTRTGAASKMQMSGPNSTSGNVLCKDRPRNPELKIDDDLLLKINVRDLNVKLKGTTKDQQTKTKQRRRTLKNRIYAQNCRNKRNEQKTKLEIAKIQLEQDLKVEQVRSVSLQKDMARLQNELARERQIVHSLRNELGKLHNDAELLHQKLRENVARSASNNAASRCSSANLATNLSVTSSVGEY